MTNLIATDRVPAKVHISVMSGKLKGISAINTNTMTNEFCEKMYSTGDDDVICTHCYSKDMLSGSRKNCQPSFQRNSDLLSSRALLPAEIPILNERWFRYDGHGELINVQHLHNLVLIAESNPWCNFGLWTKRKGIVNEYRKHVGDLPSNIILIFSNPRLDRILHHPPAGFDKVFNNVPKDYTGDANCTGQKCIECRVCYEHNDVDCIIEHVKKRS